MAPCTSGCTLYAIHRCIQWGSVAVLAVCSTHQHLSKARSLHNYMFDPQRPASPGRQRCIRMSLLVSRNGSTSVHPHTLRATELIVDSRNLLSFHYLDMPLQDLASCWSVPCRGCTLHTTHPLMALLPSGAPFWFFSSNQELALVCVVTFRLVAAGVGPSFSSTVILAVCFCLATSAGIP